jgi:hypothetical protein
MAVQRGSYCTTKNPLKPFASINELLYNHAHNDWMVLGIGDFTLLFNERVDGSNPSSLNFLSQKIGT